jgi:rare lipoprotein A
VVYFFITISLLASCATYEKYPESGYAVASWYGSEFHGRPTSSGEIFDMYSFTCAHKEFPFGTKLKITNVSNNKSVNCIVNDRGPFISGRDIDLSYAAADEVGIIGKGTSRVRIEHMGRDTTYVKEVMYLTSTGPFAIQVGSFRELSNAVRLKKVLELKYDKVYINEVKMKGGAFYRVRIGKFLKTEDAVRLARTLADEGFSVFVVGYDEGI